MGIGGIAVESGGTFLFGGVRVTIYRDKNAPFLAGGRRYRGVAGLSARLRLARHEERYPCFDSSDDACENRYYRWFFPTETLVQAIRLSGMLRRGKVRLHQLFPPGPGTCEADYDGLPLPAVFCEDDFAYLIVVERER